MARPIEATPVLRGRDAQRLLDDLAGKNYPLASEAEMVRRTALAKERLEKTLKK